MKNTPLHHALPGRRRFLRHMGAAAAALTVARWFEIPGAYADALVQTPEMTEGPFYPDHLPLDQDNDLIIINDAVTPAVGTITHLGGRILDAGGNPVRDAQIEIWQVDNYGSYIHSHGLNGRRDPNFQGYGRFLTDSTGEYRFRTIRPVPYPGRTPHIHVKVKIKDTEQLTTQIFIRGEPHNPGDGILNDIRDSRQRAAVLVDFAPVKNSKLAELAANFDIVLGATPSA